MEEQGYDYSKLVSPVSRHETMRLVIAVACRKAWHIYHLDVKSTFLNDALEEIVFVTQPIDFIIKGKKDRVYKLHKKVYGSKEYTSFFWN